MVHFAVRTAGADPERAEFAVAVQMIKINPRLVIEVRIALSRLCCRIASGLLGHA
jgi:hypothetical protein